VDDNDHSVGEEKEAFPAPAPSLEKKIVRGKGRWRFWLSFLVLGLLAFGGYFYYEREFVNKQSLELVSPINTDKSGSFEIDLSGQKIRLVQGDLAAKNLSRLAPVGIDAFVVLNDPGSFYNEFAEKNSPVDVKEVTGLSVEEASSFLNSSFVLIFRDTSWAFMSQVKNKDFVSGKISNISLEDKGIHVSLIDDYLVISNDASLMSEIENVQKGLSLSLSQDSFFLESTKNLPLDGSALAFFRDPVKFKQAASKIANMDNFDPKGRNAFVARNRNSGVVLTF